MKVENPVLPGFNPDPSFVKAGEDYYIATSTFEWFPGVYLPLQGFGELGDCLLCSD